MYIILNIHFHYVVAEIYLLSNNNNILGENLRYTIPNNNSHSLEYFAKKFKVGLRNLLAANPDIDLYLPDSGKPILIPKKLILPNTPHKGIIINIAEMRLYYYPNTKNNNIVMVFPISIGTPTHETPSQWITSIKDKKKDPIWIPTQNIRNEYIKRAEILPLMILSGPNNPLGSYALYLGNSYAIHGSNTNLGIGLRVTRGCIRLRTEDIKLLYTLVPLNTRVQFINEPIKIAIDSNGMQYLEIHTPLSTINNKQDNKTATIHNLKIRTYTMLQKNNFKNINFLKVNQALEECLGIPIEITT
ncbi:Protein erfK/srfK [Candidatus Blochmanniella vafra str. BVAF]|uniref:Protein erfK/srfK n=2 Tax=Candidatus Blochmanniella vafra TaxID=251535 RepID=E8Q6B2_BLOVB|nr:Protein erfK/srfK [Candidatus Blochmannia vafer str. BVAF]